MSNKSNKNNKLKEQPKKKLFGRNIFTFLFVAISVVVLFFLFYIPYSYISTYSKANPTPFDTNVTSSMKSNVGIEDTSSTTSSTGANEIKMTDGAKIMKGKDFNDLDLKFYAQTYDQEKGNVTFYSSLAWNENTTKLVGDGNLAGMSSSSTYNLYMYVCISSKWIRVDDKPFANYSSLQSFKIEKPTGEEKTGAAYTRSSISLSGLTNFPYKTALWTETFPTSVYVGAPTAYLYLYFIVENTDKTTTNYRYILEFDYNEYHTNETVGGIIAK